MSEPIAPGDVHAFLTQPSAARRLSRPRVIAGAASDGDLVGLTAYSAIGQQHVRYDEVEGITTVSLVTLTTVLGEPEIDSHPLAAVRGDIRRAFKWLRRDLDHGPLDALVIRRLRNAPAADFNDTSEPELHCDLARFPDVAVLRHRRTTGRTGDRRPPLEHFLTLREPVPDAPREIGRFLHATVIRTGGGYRLQGFLTDVEDVSRIAILDEALRCAAPLATEHLTAIAWEHTIAACRALGAQDAIVAIARATAASGINLALPLPPFDVVAREVNPPKEPGWLVTLRFDDDPTAEVHAWVISAVREELLARGVDVEQVVTERAPR